MIEHYREDDILYVWWLERSGRSHIIDLVLSLNEKGMIIKGIIDGVILGSIERE